MMGRPPAARVFGTVPWRAIIALLAISGDRGVVAQEAPDQAPQGNIEVLPTESDATGWAFDALLKYPADLQPFMRFVWIPPYGDREWIGAINYAVNAAASHSRVLHRADLHAGGWLLAYNLKKLAPNKVDLQRLISVWDGLAVSESRFHVPQINVKTESPVALLSPHLQENLARHVQNIEKSERVDVLVTTLTNSTGAIYPADFLIEQLLSSLRGRYVEFRGMTLKSDSEHTAVQELLQKRGFFLEASQELRGDKGAIQLVSEITGKSRIIMAVYGLASRTPMTVTFDFKDSTIRPDEQFIRNLIEFDAQSDASEIFIPLPNGLLEFVLGDERGNIIRSAPADVAADYTKPDGHTKELEMGMSCIICHSAKDGYHPVKNDLEFLVGSDTDFFGDELFSQLKNKGTATTKEEALDIVSGRYGEPIDDPDGILGRARRDLVRAVDMLTDYEVADDGKTSVQRVGNKIKNIWHEYRYQRIDADRACLELGVRVPFGGGREVLKKLIPPPPPGQTEDIVIALLRNGAAIKRDDMTAIYVEMARRAIITRPLFTERGKNDEVPD